MKFLDTKDKLSILETDSYQTVVETLDDFIFDYQLNQFHSLIEKVTDGLLQQWDGNSPLLFSIGFRGLSDEELIYFGDLLYEVFIEHLMTNTKKFEEDLWQPRTEINDILDMTMKPKIKLINYVSKIPVFNIEFNNGQVQFDMFKKEKK